MKISLFKFAICVFVLSLAGQAKAAMVYDLPFSSGGSASLANFGTAGGNATIATVASLSPTSSTDVPANLGDSYSESFPSTSSGTPQGGNLILPSGTTHFQMATAGNQMTFSTWLKWNGPAVALKNSTIISNENGAQNQGWGLTVSSGGLLVLNTTAGNRWTTSATTVPVGTWVNIALTYTAGGDPVFYLNGVNLGLNQSLFGAVTTASGLTLRLSTIDGTNYPINGKLDDVGMWDANLGVGKTRALYTAPTLLSGYNAGAMNSLFTAFDGQASFTLGALTWNYATGFAVTGHTLGDTWLAGDGKYYTWLSGASTGMMAVPEPATWALLAFSLTTVMVLRRRRN